MNSTQQKPSTNNETMTLKTIILIVWQKKLFLILATFLGLVIVLTAGLIYNSRASQISTFVEFQWDGVNQGEYPDGTRFDYNNLFESYILADTINQLNIPNTISSELRAEIEITPVVPGNIYELIEAELLRGNQISYFPNVFRISINHSRLGLSRQRGAEVLSLLIENYRNDFQNKFIQKTVVVDYTNIELGELDYIDSYNILRSQLKMIDNIVTKTLPDATRFTSAQFGYGFDNILVRAELINMIELRSISARINNYLLTKDVSFLITRYRFEVEQAELNLKKYQDIAVGLEDLITNYKGTTATIIIPGIDAELIETSPYLNTLYEELVETKIEIANTEQDITYLNLRIDRLLGVDPSFIITPEQIEIETAIVETAIIRTNQSIAVLVDDFNVMLEEYNQFLTRSFINPLMSPQFVPRVNIVIFALAGAVFGGSIGLAIIFVNYQKKD